MEEEQNITPQNQSLWDKDYFEMKVKQHTNHIDQLKAGSDPLKQIGD